MQKLTSALFGALFCIRFTTTFNAGLNVMDAESNEEIARRLSSHAQTTSQAHSAVQHSNPSERITVQQALRMATYNGAWTTFDEKERGSLEASKVADMVILSDNPYTVDNDKICDIKVEQLILAGKPHESAVTALGRTIWNGIFTRNKY